MKESPHNKEWSIGTGLRFTIFGFIRIIVVNVWEASYSTKRKPLLGRNVQPRLAHYL